MMAMLPFPEKPSFICYHNKAFPFGIIQANAPEDTVKWLTTKCVNIVFNPNSPQNKFDLAIWDTWGNLEGITTRQDFNIKKALIPLIKVDLLSMFRVFIDNGCYIHGTYNEKYIPLKWAYEKEDYNHDFLIVGYDDNDFYSVGFVADGRFRHFKIPNQKLIDAVSNTGSSRVNINFFSYNDGVIPKPNVDRMLSDLDKYISTANYLDNPNPKSTSYGISALIRVKEFILDEIFNNRIYVDKRYSRVLYEHEWILSQIVDLFLDEDERLQFFHYTEQNLSRAKLIHLLGLKIEYTRDVKIIQRIANYIDKIVEDEMNYIPQLISVLRVKQESGNLK